MSHTITPASFSQRFVPLADGCFRDIGRKWLAADGSHYHLEWTPTSPEGRVGRQKAFELASACTLAGGGWSMPEADELETLVNRKTFDPATYDELREDTKSEWYHTATDDASSSDDAIYVDFSYGLVYWGYRDFKGFARFVRRVPASQ